MTILVPREGLKGLEKAFFALPMSSWSYYLLQEVVGLTSTLGLLNMLTFTQL